MHETIPLVPKEGLRIEQLTTPFLHQITLSIQPGEMVVITGPSGSGKTTLLRAIAGLQPCSGSIVLNGRNIEQYPTHHRHIAMLFQNHALFPHLTVAQNILFACNQKSVAKQFSQLISMLKIESLLKRYPEAISGGERQRVALAQVLLRKPQLLLLDEPLSHLDPTNQYILREEIKQLQHRLQIPILYITHDQFEATGMADRLGVLIDGSLLQLDLVDTVYQRPSCLEVAKSIGLPPINLIPGKIYDQQFLSPHLPPQLLPTEKQEMKGILAIRPEQIYLTKHGFPATVVRTENHGVNMTLCLQVGELLLRCHLSKKQAISNATVRIAFDMAHSCFFPSH